MNNGNIEQVGKPLDLYNKPENQFVAGFIGSPKMNFFNIATLETNIKKLAPKNAFTLGLRPEHLSLHGKNSIEFLVNNVEQLGADSFIYGKTSDNQDLSMKLNQQTNIRQNEKIKANFDLKFAHWFDKNKNIIL